MREFRNDIRYADFPLGGIGTGTICLSAAGKLKDFQIFNRPSLGMRVPYTFFSMFSRWGNHEDARMLEADGCPDYYEARGYHPSRTMGMPKFASSVMTVRYPFAKICFADDRLPLKVSMTAFNPCIPSEPDDSGIPGIVFHFDVENTGKEDAEVLVASSMGNIHNMRSESVFGNPFRSEHCFSRQISDKDISGVFLSGNELADGALGYANNAIMTNCSDAELCPYWGQGDWFDQLADFWNYFSKGSLPPLYDPDKPDHQISHASSLIIGSVGVRRTIAPGKSERFTFVLSWYVPNRVKGWYYDEKNGQTMKNYYAVLYRDAWDAGSDLLRRLETLEQESRTFSDNLYASTLSDAMLDAVASNISILRSNTCWRTPDGTLMGWEGCHEQSGSCHGTCTHVWNYAQTVASLFPTLEQSARFNEFLSETNEAGKMNFRSSLKFGIADRNSEPAIDGQFGTIIRAWREWTLTGDRMYLNKVYPSVVRAFEFAMREWDKNGDGVAEACQLNTYDIQFYGENPQSALLELGAIRAVSRMAEEMGDTVRAEAMNKLFSKAQSRFMELCWQGEFFIQHIDDVDRHRYQFGEGCLSDQLFGQTMACLSGLGFLLPEDRLRSAANAIYKYNFRKAEEPHTCLQRVFIHRDEAGLIVCTWPNGGRPRFPFPYSDEVWTGMEYQVATLFVYLGMLNEAETIVRAVRSRYDGTRRNPWSETECGFYYARAQASWGLLIAMSGFSCNLAHRYLSFHPQKEGTYFWSAKGTWGTFSVEKNQFCLRSGFGNVAIEQMSVPKMDQIREISLNGKTVEGIIDENIQFKNTLILSKGDELVISYTR